MTRVLLTTVCRPFGGPGEGDSVGAELFHAQVTRAQGIFSLRQVIRCWGLDYLAENIEAPAVVLHYPSERELVRELRSGCWDYVGVNFVVATFYKLRQAVALIREHAPAAKVVLGGYGTVLPDETLAPYGDLVCREEGVAFLRRLLGENPDRPLRHPYASIESPRLYSHERGTRVAHVTGGLGCPNGCDFCSTSHFFNRRYVPFARSGRELFEALTVQEREAARQGDELGGFILIDEDFFLHARRAREFLACVRERGRPFSLMGFGSVRGLSQFTADEIAEMGFEVVWTSFEGRRSGYGKLEGRPLPELYADLRARGVAVLSSMIIGFAYQDRDQIREEFAELMALEPAMVQVLIHFAFPGTPFHEQVVAEGRYRPEYRDSPDYRRFDGFSMHFDHPRFGPGELECLQRELYRRDFELLGPSFVRLFRTWLEGYRNLRDSGNPLLCARAELLARTVRDGAAGLYPAKLFGPNRSRRREARELLQDVAREFGLSTPAARLRCWATVPLAAWTWAAQRLNHSQQPRLLRTEHRWQAAPATDPSPSRLPPFDVAGVPGAGAAPEGEQR
jgi:haloalkane dehalogenase